MLLVEDDPGDALNIVKPRDFDGLTAMIKQVDECYLGLVSPPPGPGLAG